MEVVTGRSKCGQVLPFKQEERPDPVDTNVGCFKVRNTLENHYKPRYTEFFLLNSVTKYQ